MRLIDADKLIEAINNPTTFEGQLEITLEDFVDLVYTQPTVYNPEKVVEELEERSKEYNSGVRLHGKPEEMLTHDAIDIVKRGYNDYSS